MSSPRAASPLSTILLVVLRLAVACCIAAQSGWLASPVTADERPNIIYIMGDDMGYSDIGCYGGEIETPNLNELAQQGVRFSQFYNMARCCPTRACLLTGLYPHQAGVGWMMSDNGHDGYRGELNRNCVTLAEVLGAAGYATYMAGKWHVTKAVRPESADDKHNWPLQRGFDRFYGTIHGAGSFYDPFTLARGNEFVSPVADPEYQDPDGFYYTDAISDHAARFIQEHQQQGSDDPFFMYVSYTAAHWPMHARERDIAKYQGKYDGGYESIRRQRYRRLLAEGLISAANTEFWPMEESWKEDEAFREWDNRNMEVYAAMVDSMDQGIGQIVDALRQTGQLDNTLLLFFQDNGGCAENYGRKGEGQPRAKAPTLEPLADDYLQPDMQPKQTRDGYPIRTGKNVMAGPADTYIGYGKGWATVSNTPFREYKHWVHEGGISTPLIAHWPAGIKACGAIAHTPAHLIDLMATAVDVAGAHYPQTFHDGQSIKPMEGKSLVPAFSGKQVLREALFWEHEGNRAVRVGDLKLVAKGSTGAWELYDLSVDRTEQHDLAHDQPAKVEQLAELWQQYARRANVLPLTPYRDNKAQKKNQQKFKKNKLTFRLRQGQSLDRSVAPYIPSRGISVTCKLSSTDNGVLLAQGGATNGWVIYLRDGHLCLAVTAEGEHSAVTTESAIGPGAVTISASRTLDGDVNLICNGQSVGTGVIHSWPGEQPADGLQVGVDDKGQVGDYNEGYAYPGKLAEVVIKLHE